MDYYKLSMKLINLIKKEVPDYVLRETVIILSDMSELFRMEEEQAIQLFKEKQELVEEKKAGMW